ncbi:MAG TPA: DNA internalization-related competence protein ComEC/Rec2 [Actinobacteria bacterium]|nr:DNA internalization-related competence protein ComEC/Rec2 [Actinomycetota bacterium]
MWRVLTRGSLVAVAVAAAAAGGIAGALALARPAARAALALVAAGFLAGAIVSAAQGYGWCHQTRLVRDCGAREWVGQVEADPMPGAYGATLRVRLVGGPLDGARVRVYWPQDAEVPDLGRTVRFSAVLDPLPLAEEWARRVARTGACATGSAWRAEVGDWRPGVTGPLFAWRARVLARMHGIPGVGGDLLEGIVLGDRRRLYGTEADEEFRVLGLTHLVAVSGSHLALACGAVALAGSALHVRRRILVFLTVAAGAAYAVVTGMAYSALRSLMMLGVGGAAQLAGRRTDGMASLAVAVVCVLALEPWSVYDVGFQLSVLAVGSLFMFGSLATEWAAAGAPMMLRPAMSALALTLVAQVVTVPVIASCFGMVSLMAPLANGYAGPLISVALWLGLGASVALEIVPGPAMLLMRLSSGLLSFTAWVSSRLADVPGAAIVLGGGPLVVVGPALGAALVWLWWPHPRSPRQGRLFVTGALACSVALAVGPPVPRDMSITVLDVGQGDAILVRDGGRTMLVDTGPDETALRAALAREGVRAIDVLVLTHAHDDHTGGVGGLRGVVDMGWTAAPGIAVEGFTVPGSAVARVVGPETVRGVSAGDSWRLGTTTVKVVWPPRDVTEELSTNDTSIVLKLQRGAFDALLTGDAEHTALAGIAAAGDLQRVELLKVPHHGSDNGLTQEALDLLRPHDAVISVGEGNDFGHPCVSVLEMLHGAGCVVWRTDRQGDVVVEVGTNGYRVRSQRRGSRTALRARMGISRGGHAVPVAHTSAPHAEALNGREGARGPQAGLPDIRRRGPAARARPPPSPWAHSRGRRSRVQLRGVPGRERGCG